MVVVVANVARMTVVIIESRRSRTYFINNFPVKGIHLAIRPVGRREPYNGTLSVSTEFRWVRSHRPDFIGRAFRSTKMKAILSRLRDASVENNVD